jgi:hypothetical protein
MLSVTGCSVQKNLIRTKYIYVVPPKTLYKLVEEPKPDRLETNWDLLMWSEELLKAVRERDADRDALRKYIEETINREEVKND